MSQNIIQGRPDFTDHNFGKTRAKKHPKYVYTAQGMLLHEVAFVELRWWDANFDRLVRRESPSVTIMTRCGQCCFGGTRNGKRRSTTCELPKPDAVLCGRCQRRGAVFPKKGPHSVTKREAKARLGCVMQVEEQ